MTKQDLIVALAQQSPFFLSEDVGYAVSVVLDSIVNSLARGERVEIRGFGSFIVQTRAPRLSRNPKTGTVIKLPSRKVIHFKPGKVLRESVKNDYGHPVLD